MFISNKPNLPINILISNNNKNNNLSAPWSSGFFYKNGREAILTGIEKLGIKKGSRVLVPAYICSSVTEYLKFHGFELIFLDTNKNLTFDFSSIRGLIQTKSLDVIIMIDYFGFLSDQNIEIAKKIKKLNDKVFIISDRCHSALSNRDIYFDYKIYDAIVFSIRKTIPNYDSGILFINNKNEQRVEIRKDVLMFFLFLIRYLLEKIFNTSKLGNIIYENLKKIKNYFIRENHNKIKHGSISKISWLLYRQLSNENYINYVKDKRINNYFNLFDEIKKTKINILFNCSLIDTAPQIFPIIDNSGKLLDYLKKNHIAAYRWPDLEIPFEVSENKKKFQNANELNNKVICLPIHQSLSKEEISYMKSVLDKWSSINTK